MLLSSHAFLIFEPKYCCCPKMRGFLIFGTFEIDCGIVQTLTNFSLYFNCTFHIQEFINLCILFLIVHDKRLSIWLHILSYIEMF